MRQYSSGLRGQTVNLLTSVFVGSNPTWRTLKKHPCKYKGVFYMQNFDYWSVVNVTSAPYTVPAEFVANVR